MSHMKAVSLIDTRFNLEDKEVICYPYLIVAIRIYMQRPFLKPRIAHTVVTADLVKGIALRANMFPPTSDIEISNSSLVPALIPHEEAIKKARKLALRWAIAKFHLFRTPTLEIVKTKQVYKAFFYVHANGNKILVDSVKGLEGELIK